MRYTGPDIRNREYRYSWIASWLAEGSRGVRFLEQTLEEMAGWRPDWRDDATLEAMTDIRRALEVES